MINPSEHIAPQGLPVLEKQLERLLRNPNALLTHELYGKPWSDAVNEAGSWVDREQRTIKLQLAENVLARSGHVERRLALEIPFEAAERRVAGFLESRHCVLDRLAEVRRILDEQSAPSERTARHQREIARFERILGIDDHGVRHVEEDEEYGPTFHLVKKLYRDVQGRVRSNVGRLAANQRGGKLRDFADSLLREAKEFCWSYSGKANAELLREIQSRLEHERQLLTQAAKPTAAQPVNHYNQLKERVSGWFTKWKVPAAIILIVGAIVLGVTGLDDFLDALEGIGRRFSISLDQSAKPN